MSEFKFTQDYTIATPREKKVYPVYHSDWARLKKMVKSVIPGVRIFQILYSISFSVFVSSIFTLLGFASAKEVPPWITLIAWVLLYTSVIIGIALVVLDNQQKELIKISAGMILDEMQVIEDNCNSGNNESLNAIASKRICQSCKQPGMKMIPWEEKFNSAINGKKLISSPQAYKCDICGNIDIQYDEL